MKIKLEKYLKNKREQLDVEDPDKLMLWEGIRKELNTKKHSLGFNVWKVAAIFLTVFTLSYIIYNEVSKESEMEFTLAQIHQSLGDREQEYKNIILEKMQSSNIQDAEAYPEDNIFPALFNELVELDTIYAEAMQDLEQHGYLERTVDIIFDTYEKRIRILEKIIMESQKSERYETNNQQVIL